MHKSGEVFFHYLKETKAELLLINQKEIKGTWVQSNEWLLKSWLPLVLKTSLKKISFVSSEDDFGKYSLLKFIEKIDQIDINAFSNFNEALAWLLKKEYNYKLKNADRVYLVRMKKK
ncbi:MAG: hypothetical protein U5K00_07810 [Melioribacteraceae bacterium]|nr:hypothetical protein [Melioribacteraceae bacterium]